MAKARGFLFCFLVNNWSLEKAQAHVNESFSDWEIRNQFHWETDFSWIETLGIPPPSTHNP